MKRVRWTPRALEILRSMYADSYAKDIAKLLRCRVSRVHAKANQLGLTKSAAFYTRQHLTEAERLRKHGCAHRFHKGQVPPNKGLRRPGWAPGRMAETQFKKGGFPVNRDPDFYVLGALRVNADGYIDMRVSFEPGARGWRGLHTILWEDAHGPVPPAHCLIFRNGDSLDVELGNLELITRAENMRRNSVHNLPEPLRLAILTLGHLKRRINGKQRKQEDGGGPPGEAVCDDRRLA